MSKPVPAPARIGRHGFTLLELLVSITVLTLLLVILLSMVDTATKLWRTNENRVDAYREARAAINMIANDLASAYASNDPNLFFTQKDTDFTIPGTATEPGMDGRLFFLTSLPTEAQEEGKNKSDLCTVGYFLGFARTSLLSNGKDDPSLNLYRYFRSSGGDTSDSGTKIDNSTYLAMIGGDPIRKIPSGTLWVANKGAGTSSEVLAKNITGFEINAYSTSNSTATGLTPFTKSATTPVPDVVEIRLKALNNDTARRLKGNESAWKTANNPLTKQEERTFVVRVRIPGAAAVKVSPSPTPSPTP